MNLNHLILTEPNFRSPTWQHGLKNVSIVPFSGGEPFPLPGDARRFLVWILSSAPDWEALVRHYSKQCPVIVLSKLTSLPEMQKALEAGARGYIEAMANPIQLGQAASTVSQGALWIAAPMLSRLLAILSGALPEPRTPAEWQEKLSPRELEVAEVVATGVTNREVAEQLHITVRTVKEHLTSIFAKLGVHDRLQLILMARGGEREKHQ